MTKILYQLNCPWLDSIYAPPPMNLKTSICQITVESLLLHISLESSQPIQNLGRTFYDGWRTQVHVWIWLNLVMFSPEGCWQWIVYSLVRLSSARQGPAHKKPLPVGLLVFRQDFVNQLSLRFSPIRTFFVQILFETLEHKSAQSFIFCMIYNVYW